MDMAWFAPAVMLFLPEAWRLPSWVFLIGFWAIMMGMILIAHLLEESDIASPIFEIIVAALLITLAWLAIQLFVFPETPLWSWAWVGELFSATDALRKVVVILGTLAFLWWRAVVLLQREVDFFIIGYDFRKGVLALLLSVSLYHYLSGQSGMIFVAIFFFFGLLAVAIGRTEDIARDTGQGRVSLPPSWAAVVALNTMAVLALAWGFGQFWSLQGFRALGRSLQPIFGWISPYVEAAMLFLLQFLEPLLQWLVRSVAGVMGGEAGQEVLGNLGRNAGASEPAPGDAAAVYAPPSWLLFLFQYVIPILVGITVLLVLVFWLAKRRSARPLPPMSEEHVRVHSMEKASLRQALHRGYHMLKDWVSMVGRFGMGRKFYSALTIRHIYANLQKLAAERGAPRAPTWTPNDYLPHLMHVFPDCPLELHRITAAYNAYEYGQVPTDPETLQQLRNDWKKLQATPPIDATPDAPTSDRGDG